ncbi:hypothetical protein [Paenibacillus soyae]|uniref:DUF4309 domain-containing protein n=1 Tax=Paenibacillus soyae TaxID=2969249 RepID=A0A9X2S873_9BACL|nr:hypothetical protein [Paenibacillus soyae]MCR2803781.1 hypothetical protein [Paenibacillus soyae]
MNAQANPRRFLGTAVALFFAASLTACQSPNPQPVPSDGRAITQGQPDLGQNTTPDEEPPLTRPADNETSTETSSMQTNNSNPADSGTLVPSGQWNVDAPMLKGISLKDSRTDIIKQYGSPYDSYSLNDPSGEIEVLEYDGYSVGIDPLHTVHFVEVYDPEVSTELGGLRVGRAPDIAELELGEPKEESDFLLLYEARGASLRIELDPQRNEIVAVKLIAER